MKFAPGQGEKGFLLVTLKRILSKEYMCLGPSADVSSCLLCLIRAGSSSSLRMVQMGLQDEKHLKKVQIVIPDVLSTLKPLQFFPWCR